MIWSRFLDNDFHGKSEENTSGLDVVEDGKWGKKKLDTQRLLQLCQRRCCKVFLKWFVFFWGIRTFPGGNVLGMEDDDSSKTRKLMKIVTLII